MPIHAEPAPTTEPPAVEAPAASVEVIDNPDQRTAIAKVMAKMGLTADDITNMEIPGGRAASEPAAAPEAAAAETPEGEAPAAETPAAEAAPTDPAAPKPLPTAEERKVHLQKIAEASKAERNAKKALKQAQEAQTKAAQLAAQAQAFEAAKQGWEKDPAKLIDAAGIPRSDFFKTLTELALAGDLPAQPEPDPVELKVQAAIAPYIKAQQEAAAAAQAAQEAQQEFQVKATKVFPVIAQKAKDFELLIAAHGGNISAATDYVYDKIKQHYLDTFDPATGVGESYSVEEAAQQLEEWHEEQLRSAAEAMKKTAKFAGMFRGEEAAAAPAQHAPPAVVVPAAPAAAAAPKAKPTLSSAMNAAPPAAAPKPQVGKVAPNIKRSAASSPKSFESYSDKRKDEINEILKGFGLV
ncbi:MAG TPA: hypothetical protein VNH84_12745 [Candidatus Saccharimonadales bacterium]|nr:hypothetical protein [Candidatus Saccharimonadales bacterium]